MGIVAQVKLNPQRIKNLTDKQRANLCMTMQTKFKGPNDHLTELRRNERNKSNKKHSDDGTEASTTTAAARGSQSRRNKGNKENIVEDSFENESDDERSSGDGEESDIEKYFNFDEKSTSAVIASKDAIAANTTTSTSALNNFTKLLKSRRHATPGMSTINPLYNNSNLNLSSSSCSTPTSIYPSSSVSANHHPTQQQQQPKSSSFFGKANKRDLTLYDDSMNASQPTTPKKSNNNKNDDAESDSSDRCINRLSARTKLFLTSFLKFKRSLRVKRRNSSSCSDLFVI